MKLFKIIIVFCTKVLLTLSEHICLNASIDVVFKSSHDVLHIFRKDEYWTFKSNREMDSLPSIINSRSILEDWGIEGPLDAGYIEPRTGYTYLFRGKHFFVYKNRRKLGGPVSIGSHFKRMPTEMDTAWFRKAWTPSEDRIHFLNGYLFWTYDIAKKRPVARSLDWLTWLDTWFVSEMEGNLRTEARSLADYLGLPAYIDASYGPDENGFLYLFKGNYLYKMHSAIWENGEKIRVKPQIIQDLFLTSCKNHFNYTEEGFEDFVDFKKFYLSKAPLSARLELKLMSSVSAIKYDLSRIKVSMKEVLWHMFLFWFSTCLILTSSIVLFAFVWTVIFTLFLKRLFCS